LSPLYQGRKRRFAETLDTGHPTSLLAVKQNKDRVCSRGYYSPTQTDEASFF